MMLTWYDISTTAAFFVRSYSYYTWYLYELHFFFRSDYLVRCNVFVLYGINTAYFIRVLILF